MGGARLTFWRANPCYRQCQAKDRAGTGLILGPYSASMGLDDRTRNRESHAHSHILGREKGLENLL